MRCPLFLQYLRHHVSRNARLAHLPRNCDDTDITGGMGFPTTAAVYRAVSTIRFEGNDPGYGEHGQRNAGNGDGGEYPVRGRHGKYAAGEEERRQQVAHRPSRPAPRRGCRGDRLSRHSSRYGRRCRGRGDRHEVRREEPRGDPEGHRRCDGELPHDHLRQRTGAAEGRQGPRQRHQRREQPLLPVVQARAGRQGPVQVEEHRAGQDRRVGRRA